MCHSGCFQSKKTWLVQQKAFNTISSNWFSKLASKPLHPDQKPSLSNKINVSEKKNVQLSKRNTLFHFLFGIEPILCVCVHEPKNEIIKSSNKNFGLALLKALGKKEILRKNTLYLFLYGYLSIAFSSNI